MKLYLVRHGEALLGEEDATRPLSANGQAQVHQLAQLLVQEGAADITHIYHSGILRAQQTAEIIAQQLKVAAVEKRTELLPEDDVDLVSQESATWTQNSMLVGHLPYMANLLWSLCEEDRSIQFTPATAVCLEKIKNQWVIKAVFKPEDSAPIL